MSSTRWTESGGRELTSARPGSKCRPHAQVAPDGLSLGGLRRGPRVSGCGAPSSPTAGPGGRPSALGSWARVPRVVVVGAGFDGLAAATGLARIGIQVMLVDRLQYTTFQPLLYQVATGGLNQEDVAVPVRSLLRRLRTGSFVRGSLAEVDWPARLVRLDDGIALPFDLLVLATGAATSFFGVEGATTHALPLYTLTDAARLRDRLIHQLERAARSAEGPPRAGAVGGGCRRRPGASSMGPTRRSRSGSRRSGR